MTLSFREYTIRRYPSDGSYVDGKYVSSDPEEIQIYCSIQPINYYVRGMREKLLEEGLNAREVLKVFAKQELKFWKGGQNEELFKPDEIFIGSQSEFDHGEWYVIASFFDYSNQMGGLLYRNTNFINQFNPDQSVFDRMNHFKYLATKKEIRQP